MNTRDKQEEAGAWIGLGFLAILIVVLLMQGEVATLLGGLLLTGIICWVWKDPPMYKGFMIAMMTVVGWVLLH